MKPKTQRTVAGLAVGASLSTSFGAVLLLLYVPRPAACRAESGAELPPAARMLLHLGHFAQRSFFLLGLLVVATFATVAWRVAAVRKVRRMETE